MSEMTRAETLYEADLKRLFRDVSTLYSRWTQDLVLGKTVSDYWNELHGMEFSIYDTVCEDTIMRSSELVDDLNRLFFVDTSELSVAIHKARQEREKARIEMYHSGEGKHEEGIQSIKNAVDNLFKVYSTWKATKRNKERHAFSKWGTVLGGAYSGLMVLYFAILNFMKCKPDLVLGVAIPVFVAYFVILLPILAVFSRE